MQRERRYSEQTLRKGAISARQSRPSLGAGRGITFALREQLRVCVAKYGESSTPVPEHGGVQKEYCPTPFSHLSPGPLFPELLLRDNPGEVVRSDELDTSALASIVVAPVVAELRTRRHSAFAGINCGSPLHTRPAWRGTAMVPPMSPALVASAASGSGGSGASQLNSPSARTRLGGAGGRKSQATAEVVPTSSNPPIPPSPAVSGHVVAALTMPSSEAKPRAPRELPRARSADPRGRRVSLTGGVKNESELVDPAPACISNEVASLAACWARPPTKALCSMLLGGRYVFGRYLGRGASSTVWEANHTETQLRFAVKVFDQGTKDRRQATREIKLLSRVNHPRLLKVFEVLECQLYAHLVCELVDGESLRAFAQRQPGHRMQEGLARQFYFQLVDGVSYCHDRLVVHRDLKLENLLLDKALQNVKIIDFGFAAQVASKDAKLRAFCGTPSYMAPEIIRGEAYSGFATDVWALGVVVFALLAGTLPFAGRTEMQLYAKIRRGVYTCPDVLSEMPRRLVKSILRMEAAMRPPASALLRNAWVLGVADTVSAGFDRTPEEVSTVAAVEALARADSFLSTSPMLSFLVAAGVGGGSGRAAPSTGDVGGGSAICGAGSSICAASSSGDPASAARVPLAHCRAAAASDPALITPPFVLSTSPALVQPPAAATTCLTSGGSCVLLPLVPKSGPISSSPDELEQSSPSISKRSILCAAVEPLSPSADKEQGCLLASSPESLSARLYGGRKLLKTTRAAFGEATAADAKENFATVLRADKELFSHDAVTIRSAAPLRQALRDQLGPRRLPMAYGGS